MCGIAGILSPNQCVSDDTLQAMQMALVHRGPDGGATWIAKDRRAGFVHRRLSIIDLSTSANQPMQTGDGQAVIVFNGEIYNHRELRSELVQAGARFQTDHSDTEVILVGYLHWGLDELLRRLVGMFAFAIYDRREQRVVLVRDHVGIKPLYYAVVGNDLLFASEIKGLLQDPRLRPDLDHEQFHHYLSFRATPAPATLFKGIRTLCAAELLEFDLTDGGVRLRTWWNPLQSAQTIPKTLREAEDKLEELLASSVRYQLESDVPVGLFLSGGLDSAYLLQQMRQSHGHTSTYTVRYPGFERYDEGPVAAGLAATAQARHHEVSLTAADFCDALTRVAYFQDEPIAAPICTSVYFLSQAARQSGVKVVLAGEGSDEIFVGYQNWLRLRDLEYYNQRLPDLPARLLRRSLHATMSMVASPYSIPLEISRRAALGQRLFWGGALDFPEAAKRRLVGPAVTKSHSDTYEAVIAPWHRQFLDCRPESDITAWMTFIDLRFRLPQLMLPRLDKMGMAFSIEGRVPYLDHRLIEFVLSLPPQWRGAIGHRGKPLLKSVAQRKLPKSFVNSRKRGFQAPVKEWKQGLMGDRFSPALLQFARRTGLLNSDELATLLRRPNDRLYFSLTNFMLWYLIFIENVLADILPDLSIRHLRTRRAA